MPNIHTAASIGERRDSAAAEPMRLPPLGSFVSKLLGNQIGFAGDAEQPHCDHIRGVVLFVDIVSSTSMTDLVAASGPDGAELLGGMLSDYFSEVIDVVLAHGGDVIRIDGDAVIALWRDDAPSGTPHLQAARAALALRGLRHQWPVGLGPLQHRLSLVAGTFSTVILRGRGKRSFLVLAGEALRTIGEILHSVEPGEVAMDEAMARRLGQSATIEPVAGAATHRAVRLNDLRLDDLRDPAAPPPAALPPQAVLSQALPREPASVAAFVPRIVIERGASKLSGWLAEFRVLSMVYARLGESDMPDAAAAGRLRATFGLVEQVTEALGVEIFDVMASEKGITARIACGIPPFSLENNAARAVEIARRISAKLAGLGIPCSVGVTTGRAFCGDVGNAIRREYVLNGPLMNYGARLMQTAGGEALYDAATMEVTRGQFDFSPPEAIVFKGRSEPLTVYRLAEPRSAPEPPETQAAALHGRDDELARLAAVLERFRGGEGGLTALEGEPGVGKSRLLAEFADSARHNGCTVVETGTREIDQATAYFSFRRILQKLLREPGDPDDAAPALLRKRLADALAETSLAPRAALVEDIVQLGIEDPGMASQIRGAARQAGIEDIIVTLVMRRAVQRPLMLLVDDLHWIDAASADLLLALGRRLPKLLIAAASRPLDGAGPAPGVRVLLRASERIALRRVDAGSTALIISEVLKVRSIPRRLAEFVHQQSEGLPFHAEQLALSMLRLGLIETADQRCSVGAADLATAAVPHRLRDIIVSRIDGLSQTDQLALKVASVIGRVFDVEALREIFPVPTEPGNLDASMRGLVLAGFLATADGNAGTAYAFRHVITQETTYDLLSFAQRRPLHRQVAESIERRHAALQPHFAELAHHWERASDTGKALDYRLQAASLAIRGYANDDALMHVERAERLAARTSFALPTSERAQLAYVRGEALHALSRFPESAKHFGACLQLSGIHRPTTAARMVVAVLGQGVLQGLHRLGAIRKSGDPKRRHRLQLSAHVHTRFAEHAYFMNDTLSLVHANLTALNRAESIGSVTEATGAYGALAIGLGIAGMHGAARYYRDRSIRLAEQAGELADQGMAQLFAAVYSFQAGNWDATRAYCASGSSIFERLGDRFRYQTCHVLVGYTALVTGEFERAVLELEAFGPLAEAVDNAPVRAWVLAGMGILDMLRGLPPRRTLEHMKAAADEALHPAERLLCDGLEAAARLRAGEFEDAGRAATRALDSMRESVCTMGIAFFSVCAVAEVHLALAEQAMLQGAPHEALMTQAREACRRVWQYAAKTRICRPRAHLLTGRLALLDHRDRRAAAQFRSALVEAERFAMPLEQGMCYLWLAKVPGETPVREGHAARGAAVLQELGADPWGIHSGLAASGRI